MRMQVGYHSGPTMRSTLVLFLLVTACQQRPSYDVVIRHGTLYDGSGTAPRVTDLGINGDAIASIGDLSAARGKTEIDAQGMAVAPGFINMLSQAQESLIADGRAQSDIRQ